MGDALQIILALSAYCILTYFIIKYVSRSIANFKPSLRIVIVSLLYALFLGIGLLTNGGDPGFGFPAPNIVALALMLYIGHYSGMLFELYILCFWWIIIVVIMFVKRRMTWGKLKKKIYNEDSSLRDIYIRDVNPDSWKLWIDFVNANYVVDFLIGNKLKSHQIDLDEVKAYWQAANQECPSATIHLGTIIIQTYFFSESEIENDITPKEIKTQEDHENFIGYLKKISNLLGRPVEVTIENYRDPSDVLMVISGEKLILKTS